MQIVIHIKKAHARWTEGSDIMPEPQGTNNRPDPQQNTAVHPNTSGNSKPPLKR